MDTIRKADSRRGRIAYEVAGLAWLAEASDPGAPVVPVLDHGATWLEEPRLVSVAPTPRAAEDFGRSLAHTHAAGASHLGAPPPGFEGDGWMGEAHLSLPDRPSPAPASSSEGDSWGAFYARERIAPYLDDRSFTAAERTLVEKLCERLESGVLDHSQPRLVEGTKNRHNSIGAARTHGDLWSGNVMWTPEGAVLIDPAAQGGHAEEDLAALAVFGCPYYERILAPGGRLARARRPAPDAHHHDPLRRLRALLRARGRGDRPQVRIDHASHRVPARACVETRREAWYRSKAEMLRRERRSAAGQSPLASRPGRRPRRGSRGSTRGGAPT